MLLIAMFLQCVSVLLGLVVTTNAFVFIDDDSRNVSKVITVSNGDTWGVWGQPQFCPTGSYAVGFDIKVEGFQGTGDDTELNAIKLYCQIINDGHESGQITSLAADWGNWHGERSCFSPHGAQHFLTAFKLSVEPPTRGDDTAANDIQFQCRDIDGAYQHLELPTAVSTGNFGTWGEWSEQCPEGSAICGLVTRVEGPQGSGDDTALNDVKFYCCNEL